MPDSPRVLVCDDDEGIRLLLISLLEAEGFTVSCAEDGPSCIAAVEQDPPDVLVLDVMMPGMDGYQVMETLRAEHGDNVPNVVMLTAMATDEDVWRGWRAGVHYYMTKPFEPDELIRFTHFLAGSSAGDEEEALRD